MGLSGPKKRTKLSHDPNNNVWARSANFGQKIMAQQGWKPGDLLGAPDAAQSGHYTAANASHVRVMLREDNLGLGAKVGGNSADTFGLATLSGIFGRLNGKSTEAIEKQQTAFRDAELRSWQAQKLGYINFVSGGLLVGDTIQETLPDPRASVSVTDVKRKIKKSKDAVQVVDEIEIKASSDSANSDGSVEPSTSEKTKKSKTKERKRRRELEEETEIMEPEETEKRQRKEEKRLRKEERRERRAIRKAEKHARASKVAEDAKPAKESQPTPTALSRVATQTPVVFAGSRHAVRQRYIQQKRMASMDPQALKEILMIQAST